jgi:hypothetical protein
MQSSFSVGSEMQKTVQCIEAQKILGNESNQTSTKSMH